jgi:hypothetical protein
MEKFGRASGQANRSKNVRVALTTLTQDEIFLVIALMF